MFTETILSVMLMGPIMSMDTKDTLEERRQLLEPVARAIATVANETSDPLQSAAILVAVGQNETMFARYVLEGRCTDGPPGMKCDYSKKLKKSLSRGPFQVRNWCKGAWAAEDGSYESFVEGARCALHYVKRGFSRCIKTKYPAWEGAYSFYRGQPCEAAIKKGSNFKGWKYTAAMVKAKKELRREEANRETLASND